jgi:Fe-S-cluster containining protein
MDQRLKHIMDNYDKMKIGADDPFMFRCTMCGKCCIDREDILLNPKDLYKMSKELRLRPEETVGRYCDTYIGSSSGIPIVRLQPQGADKRCPLLNGSRCSVHNAKPTVCAMFPIGRVRAAGADKTEYIFVNPGCGNKREIHTVREWLGGFGIPLEDEYFLKWQQAITALSGAMQKIEKQCGKDAMSAIWNFVYAALYLCYDTEKEFMPQFESNSEQAVRAVEQILSAGAASPNGG